MKKFLFTLVLLTFFNLITIKLAFSQELPSMHFLDQFAVLTNAQIEDNNSQIINGKIGAKDSVYGSNFSIDSTLLHQDFPLLNAFSFLEKAIDKFNFMPYQNNLTNITNGMVIQPGVYNCTNFIADNG